MSSKPSSVQAFAEAAPPIKYDPYWEPLSGIDSDAAADELEASLVAEEIAEFEAEQEERRQAIRKFHIRSEIVVSEEKSGKLSALLRSKNIAFAQLYTPQHQNEAEIVVFGLNQKLKNGLRHAVEQLGAEICAPSSPMVLARDPLAPDTFSVLKL